MNVSHFAESNPQDQARRGPTASLDDLQHIQLDPHHQRMLASALQRSGGDPAWKARKQIEAADLLRLSQLAPPGRFSVIAIDLGLHLRAVVRMTARVPCRPDEHNRLRVSPQAVLGFTYPKEALREALPGYAFFQILEPRDVWLPQVHQPDQPFCIAASIPAGPRAAWLMLMAYGALTMQSVQVDAASPAGVFDPEIARWWQDNLRRYAPLSKTPFLLPD